MKTKEFKNRTLNKRFSKFFFDIKSKSSKLVYILIVFVVFLISNSLGFTISSNNGSENTLKINSKDLEPQIQYISLKEGSICDSYDLVEAKMSSSLENIAQRWKIDTNDSTAVNPNCEKQMSMKGFYDSRCQENTESSLLFLKNNNTNVQISLDAIIGEMCRNQYIHDSTNEFLLSYFANMDTLDEKYYNLNNFLKFAIKKTKVLSENCNFNNRIFLYYMNIFYTWSSKIYSNILKTSSLNQIYSFRSHDLCLLNEIQNQSEKAFDLLLLEVLSVLNIKEFENHIFVQKLLKSKYFDDKITMSFNILSSCAPEICDSASAIGRVHVFQFFDTFIEKITARITSSIKISNDLTQILNEVLYEIFEKPTQIQDSLFLHTKNSFSGETNVMDSFHMKIFIFAKYTNNTVIEDRKMQVTNSIHVFVD